jgi:hypothetical protein
MSAHGRPEPPSADYLAGYAEGYSQAVDHLSGHLSGLRARPGLDRSDLRWLLKLAHPDHHAGDGRATRVTQWLTERLQAERLHRRLAKRRTRGKPASGEETR